MRPAWPNYFMEIARMVATRSTCDRAHVGAVLVRDNTILATGFNGSIRGLPHCDDVGHDLEENHCCRTVHAEINAVAQAAREGIRLQGAVCYCTHFPCWSCFKALVNAGIVGIYYEVQYRQDERVEGATSTLAIPLVKLTIPA